MDHLGSTYIPVDSPVYPMAMRLYSLGYLDSIYLSMRPWTRRSLLHALEETTPDVTAEGNDEAQEILARLLYLLRDETPGKGFRRGQVYGTDTLYTRLLGISGTPLRDSYNFGQTIVNDYGRPYANGFNNVTGFSSVNEMGAFLTGHPRRVPVRPGAHAVPVFPLATYESCTLDFVCPFAPPNFPQATVIYGSTANSVSTFRLQEANLSYHLLGHEISFGKSDEWLGPGMGGAMAYSDNAENIYSFRINRVEPMHIPYISALVGPVRYDFIVGSLKGHTDPNDPWVHSEVFSFAPTSNFQFSFQRTVIWGGKGHVPITVHTFLKSFFSFNDVSYQNKISGDDPGARFAAFTFSYRLPFLRRTLMLYTDSEAHDDVTPPSAPRRAAYRPGLYLTHLPGLPRLDFRVEAVSTDTSTLRSLGGRFNYTEGLQPQGYTNKGFLFGDWIGREAKGGQAWLTYHLSADEFVQLSYLNKKTPKDFVQSGTTQNQFKIEATKRFGQNISVDAWAQFEKWNVPVYMTGAQNDTVIAAQFTFYPKLRSAPVPTR